MKFCRKPVPSRSRYAVEHPQLCYRQFGHEDRCAEFPYLASLSAVAPKVASKIKRDSIMTTGAAWASDDAGPNRILRWVMLMSDETLERVHGIPMAALSPIIQAKLREKAATYEDCMSVARRLTWSAYGMLNAPAPDERTRAYLESEFGAISQGATVCLVCRGQLDFDDFARARRGKAVLETAHAEPRAHNADNVGFCHRPCNIAQGDKSLNEFYDWIESILAKVRGRR